MPRKAPDGKGVIEHRMTLGNFERTFLVEQIEKNRENALYNNVLSIVLVNMAGRTLTNQSPGCAYSSLVQNL